MTDSNAKEAKDKARLTLETIVRDPQGIPAGLIVSLVLTLAIVTPHCPQNFVEDGNLKKKISLIHNYYFIHKN